MTTSVASAALVARYQFQGNYIDSTGEVDGNYENGTPYGNAHIEGFTSPIGPQQGYLHLDNTVAPASYVNCGYFNILDDPANNAFTLAAWVNPNLAWATSKDMPILQKGDEFGIKFKKDDTLECYFQSSQGSKTWQVANIDKATVAAIWADGLFHQVAGTYDPTIALLSLYVDGVLVNTNRSGTFVIGDTIVQNATRNWYIGGDSAHADRLYSGLIDDVRIYDEALSAEEVRALVPEPATIALLGLGGLALLRIRKRS
jgi:hypothetical protein